MAHSLQPYCPLFESDLVAMSKFFRLISWGDFFVYFEVVGDLKPRQQSVKGFLGGGGRQESGVMKA